MFAIKTESYCHIYYNEDKVREENDMFTKDKVLYYIDRLNQHIKKTMTSLKKCIDDNTQESYRLDKEVFKKK